MSDDLDLMDDLDAMNEISMSILGEPIGVALAPTNPARERNGVPRQESWTLSGSDRCDHGCAR